MNKVDIFIAQHEEWRPLLERLRALILSTGLEEGYKWQFPVYMLKGKNVVSLGAFKHWAGIWFFQGALLEDVQGKLMNAQEGKTQAMRQWRIKSKADIDEELILQYVYEAIENQKAGRVVKLEKKVPKAVEMPLELVELFEKDAAFKNHFDALSPGKQRDYARYIGEAKREKTRQSRLEKCITMILEGKGLNDKYM